MRILVTFALENEFAPWRKMRSFARVAAEQWDHSYRKDFEGANVRVFLTGAGRFAAQREASIALEEPADICIAAGLSGGLRPDYRVGRVLAARQVANANGFLLADPDLVSAAESAGAAVVQRFHTSDDVVASAEEKRTLGDSADAVDMESFWILSAAAKRGVRAVAIRSVSDRLDSDLPLDFKRIFNERGAVSIRKVMGQLAARPAKVGGLIRLAHDSERAASNLARVLDLFVQSVTVPPLNENAKAAALSV